MKYPILPLLFAVSLALLSGPAPARAAVLLEDDYRSMRPGLLSSDVIGAHSEYHYVPATEPHGNWVVSTFRTNPSQRAWRLIEENGERLI
jgi:hypothetical protein